MKINILKFQEIKLRTIEDLLKIELTSDIYNFQDKKRKNEEISCKCNII